jgi:cyclin-A
LDVQEEELKLVIITCLMVAAKYEDGRIILISEILLLTENAFYKKQFVDMEMKIMQAINFKLGMPLPLSFLNRLAKVVKVN